jgi:hypothetical protein
MSRVMAFQIPLISIRKASKALRARVHDRQRPRTQSTILTLPPELILVILSYLPPESVASFALTCHVFYSQFLPKIPYGSEAEVILLGWLEKELGYVVHCCACDILHDWRHAWRLFTTKTRPSYQIRVSSHDCSSCIWETAAIGSMKLCFMDVRLVMNRHLYGEKYRKYGLKVEQLNSKHVYKAMGVTQESSWEARIIDDELFIATMTTVHHETGNLQQIRVWAEETGEKDYDQTDATTLTRLDQCLHMRVRPNEAATFCIPELCGFASGPEPEPLSLIDGAVKSCPFCFTDYRMDVNNFTTPKDGLVGWVIRATKWQQLGHGRCARDDKWLRWSKSYGLSNAVWRAHTTGPGEVWRKWRAAEGRSVSTDSAMFVGGSAHRSNMSHLVTWNPPYRFSDHQHPAGRLQQVNG